MRRRPRRNPVPPPAILKAWRPYKFALGDEPRYSVVAVRRSGLVDMPMLTTSNGDEAIDEAKLAADTWTSMEFVEAVNREDPVVAIAIVDNRTKVLVFEKIVEQ